MAEKLIGLSDNAKSKLITSGVLWQKKVSDSEEYIGRFFTPSLLSSDDLVYKQHKAAYTAWLEAKADRLLPCRKDLDPLKMPQALGDLILLKPEEKNGKQDFLFRLYGTNIARRFGSDMTGRYVSDFQTEPPKAMAEQYIRLLTERLPLYGEHDAPPEISSMVRWCRLVLPFCEDAKNEDYTITRILVCNIPVDQPIDH
ncbi:PAS domain-containing protein [Curvivirga aplysinae]|uniref:PAS domain-containing protein n=1 Tax=Curvivirga aplysinae TaxID=2529852 RepID=UPI001C3F5DA8|nr:PAS domain-containing protein [Curvivirga aplysinae]